MSRDTGQAAIGRASSFNSGSFNRDSGKNDTALPEVKVCRTGTVREERGSSGLSEPARPMRSGPYQSSWSLSSSLSLPASSRTALCFTPAFPFDVQKETQGFTRSFFAHHAVVPTGVVPTRTRLEPQ